MECPKCNGTGRVKAHYEMSDPGSGRQRQRALLYSIFGDACPECEGLGTLPDPDLKDNPNYIETDDWLSQQFTEMRALQDENDALRATLKTIIRMGHNDDCIFCGFKDKVATEGLEAMGD